MEFLHDFLERHILMLEGIEHRRALAPEQFAEIRIAREIAAQRERVQEVSDQVLCLHVGPLRDRRADADVRFAAVAGEQRLEGSERENEKCHAFRACEIAHFRSERAGEITGAHPAALAFTRGPGAVRRDRQRSAIPAEPLAPESKL